MRTQLPSAIYQQKNNNDCALITHYNLEAESMVLLQVVALICIGQ